MKTYQSASIRHRRFQCDLPSSRISELTRSVYCEYDFVRHAEAIRAPMKLFNGTSSVDCEVLVPHPKAGQVVLCMPVMLFEGCAGRGAPLDIHPIMQEQILGSMPLFFKN